MQLKEFNHEQKVNYQVTPPHMHQLNAAKHAIITWKNHFISCLSWFNPKFPMHLWDLLIYQASITLNMVRTNHSNPQMSVYTALEGSFDFMTTPLDPPGTQVVVHEKSVQCNTWDPHGKDGWYVVPSPEHYR